MPDMQIWLSPVAVLMAFCLSAWLTRRFCDPSSWFHVLDKPNERSLHTSPIPRSGGVAILAGMLAGTALVMFIFGAIPDIWLLAALVPVTGVSYLDDRAGVPVLLRLLAHFAGAGLLVWGAGLVYQGGMLPGIDGPRLLWLGGLFVLVCVVWMINLYNFMDGMDGLAAGMAVIGFSFFAVMGWQAGNMLFAQISFVIAGAVGGFLVFNFPPARIFMGDMGSSVLGLLAAAFSLWGARDGILPLWAAILIFSPFIVDASVTIIRRMYRGEKIWQAHKTHFYQQLVQAGWGHRKTVLVEYAIMLGCGVTAWWAMRAAVEVQVLVLAGWALFYFSFFFWVSRLVTYHSKTGTL